MNIQNDAISAKTENEIDGHAERVPLKSLHRGLSALSILQQQSALRTVDLAVRLQIDKGLASRILHTLCATGFAEQTPDRRYRAVRASLRNGDLTPRPPIRERARPILERIVDKTGESAHLGVLADDRVLYLDRKVPQTALMVDRPIGTLAPLYSTAIGKIFLAWIGTGISGLHANDPLLPSQEELADIRQRGYATDDEGFCVGVRCAAAPLFFEDGTLAGAVSLSGPTARIDRARMHELGVLLRGTAKSF